ncbi:MAG: nicotinate (nicotinamide) nucleotide adenylyltransferase [Clostridiales bacterium]|nr:nicotinate (nicotinamide) nucleotide adenylyltransferase [Clostridiales bacterium]
MTEVKKKTQKIALFGGSFDPPHFGHLDIVKNLENAFDKVIVIPAYISPFKAGGASDEKVRFNLCKKLFTSVKTEVSRREISKKDVSYSVDTAAYFSKKYKGDKLFWVIGSEELTRLTEWHNIDVLKKLVTFFVVPRPGFAPGADLLTLLKKRGIKIKLASFNGVNISSTEIRIDLAFGKENRFLPDIVKKAADKHGLFNPYRQYVNALYKYNNTDKRISHSYGVAVRGAELAKLYGGNVNDAVIACILHDIAKSVNVADYKSKVDLRGFPEPTVHSPIGAYIAKRDFDVSDEIAHAIKVHTTGDADMSLLDEIVYLADKTEAGRNYNEVFYFRYLCAVDRELAIYAALNAVHEFRDTEPCACGERAIEYYAHVCAGRTLPAMPPRNVVADEETNKTEAEEETERKAKKASVKPNASSTEIAEAVAKELDLHKGRDIDIIDLEGKTIVADYFIIASASSSTAVKALYGYVEDMLTEKFGLDPSKRDIDREWVALDYGSVIVHIFTDRTREFYNIERLWSDGSNVRRFGGVD